MQEDAQVVNNQLFKGRGLAVILTDAGLNTRWRIFNHCRQPYLIFPCFIQSAWLSPDVVFRSLRAKNLPEDAQKPLLQQL